LICGIEVDGVSIMICVCPAMVSTNPGALPL
jgi:hypothetical protein